MGKKDRRARREKTVLFALLALAVLSVTGVLLFHHFVADQIMDKGGMMNPDYKDGTEPVSVLDGDPAYVENEKLLQVITGTWSGEDGHYVIKLRNDKECCVQTASSAKKGENIQ